MNRLISFGVCGVLTMTVAACSPDGEAVSEVEETQEALSLQSSTIYYNRVPGTPAADAGKRVYQSASDWPHTGSTICNTSIGVLIGIDQHSGASNTRTIACKALNLQWTGYSLGNWIAPANVVQQTQAEAGAGRARMFRCPAGSIARGWHFGQNKPVCQQFNVSGGPWPQNERHEGDVDANYYIKPSAFIYNGTSYSMHQCKDWVFGAGVSGAMVGGFQNWESSQPNATLRYRCGN